MNPDQPQGSAIDVFVKRVRSTENKDAKRALWMVGPIESDASNVEVSIELVSKLLGSDFDIYTLDTRGNGRSSRLGCDASQAETPGSSGGISISSSEWKNCYSAFDAEYGAQKQFYSSVNVAYDIAALIQKMNTQQETYVYGLGYGSLVVSRLLKLVEQNGLNILKGSILDSIIDTTGQNSYGGLLALSYADEITNQVGIEFLKLCNGTDNLCAQKIGNVDPIKYFHDTIEKVYHNNTCKAIKEGIPADQFKAILAFLLLGSDTKVFIPALLYRMNRCDEDLDVATILHIRDYYVAQKAAFSNLTSIPLASPLATANLIFGELYNSEISLEELKVQYNNFTSIGLGDSVYWANLKEITSWTPYTVNANFYNKTITTTVPTLLINGEFDAETPLWSAQNQLKAIQGPRALITVPKTGHMTFFDGSASNQTIPCGMQILINFLKMANPDVATVDATCTEKLQVNFSGNGVVNELVMGVSDIYEDAYEAPEVEKVVSLYLFIGVEAATVVVSIILICCLVYYIVQLKDKQKAQYEDLDQ